MIGTLSIDGEALRFANPREARSAGIRVIYQEPEIIPGVDVAENIFAGELPRRGPFIDRRALNQARRRGAGGVRLRQGAAARPDGR